MKCLSVVLKEEFIVRAERIWDGKMVGASANMYYVPAGSANAGHGFFPAGAAGGVGPGSSPPLRTMLVKQIEYYFRFV